MKRVFIILLFVVIATVGVVLGTDASTYFHPKQIISPLINNSKQTTPSMHDTAPEAVKPGIPQYLEIPSINVTADIESVGMDSQGRMDVPSTNSNVAWYNLGARPGEIGSAVIDGHFDTSTGAPAVFWNISKLHSGDEIIVTDDAGEKYTYVVTSVTDYPWDDFPLQEVFGRSDKARLNLITCGGNWDSASRNYSQRIVVYSELKQ